MSAKKDNPSMEGSVTRGVDFNLKKEDLMLLILEGRKEIMEEEIVKLRAAADTAEQAIKKFELKFRNKIVLLAFSLINEKGMNLVKANCKTAKLEDEDEDYNDPGSRTTFVHKKYSNLAISLDAESNDYEYQLSRAAPIGDGKGGAYIKSNVRREYRMLMYEGFEAKVSISFEGQNFISLNEMTKNAIAPMCREHERTINMGRIDFNMEKLKKLPEYKEYLDSVIKYTQQEALHSDIVTEYDLFNRNQPRSKAKMIKEVLSRDADGKALLENIITAAKGQKLLA